MSRNHGVAGCQLTNQPPLAGRSRCIIIDTDESFQTNEPGWMQIVCPGARSRTNTLPRPWSSSSPGVSVAEKRSTYIPAG